jgi:molecular chaperone DnaK (HSP70)
MPLSMNPRFSLGIDLGTSNCAMALADNASDSTDILPVTQIVAANQVGEMRTLPSALYLPHPEEFLSGSFRLPWDAAGPGIVGQFARDHGALVPDRLVTSASRGCPTRISIRSSARCPGGPTSPRKSCRPWSARPATCSS